MKALKRFIREFRDFAFKSSALDLAVGIIIGSAFNKIVNSLVNDILMPFTTLFTKQNDFENWTIPPKQLFKEFPGLESLLPSIKIGNFISAVVNFLLIALCIFFIIKIIGKLKKKEEEKPKEPAPTLSEQTLLEIRDLLKQQKESGK